MATDFDKLSTQELITLVTSGQTPAAEPLKRVTTTVALGSALFHWAEAGRNPQIKTVADSIHYVATSLSVGYANIFPTTPAGKLIGAWIMMVGPALAAKALDGPAASPGVAADDPAVLKKLDEILTALKEQQASPIVDAIPLVEAMPVSDPELTTRLDAILSELKKLNSNKSDKPGGRHGPQR